MSILIKGMEMPKGNDSIALFIYPDGEVVLCGRLGPLGRYTAVPVPPHGDLIDRDKMFVAFVEEGQKSKRYKIGTRWELNGEEIRHVIADLPNIIPAEPPKEESNEQ